MSDRRDLENLLDDARATGEAIGRLATDEEAFARAVEAYRGRDPDAFREVLERVGILEWCELVCDWFCSKHCTLVCLTLCGPPDQVELPPEDFREFARLTGRLAEDRESAKALVEAVERQDPEAFKAVADRLQLGRFCHLICHWVCWISCDWFCRLVCTPSLPPVEEPFNELLLQAQLIGKLASDEERFDRARAAFEAGDCERMSEELGDFIGGDRCLVFCRWFCTWRCVRVCITLCAPFPPRLGSQVKEMLAFARAMPRLVRDKDVLRRMFEAVGASDVEAWSALVSRLRIGRYCYQACHWLCFLDCRRLCQCICPPLVCEVTDPVGCVDEEPNEQLGGLTVEVQGSVGGAGFDHYTLEWRKVEGHPCNEDTGWSALGMAYPGGGSAGTSPVSGGTLGWLNTTTWSAGSYEVRLCVFGTLGGQDRRCCCTQFSLFKRLVWISRVGPPPVMTPPGPFNNTAPIVNPPGPAGIVVPVGGCVTVRGSAFVGECNDRKIKCFDLRYAPGWLPGPGDPGFSPAAFTGSMLAPVGPVCYTDPDPAIEAGKRAQWNWAIERALTTRFVQTQIEIFGFAMTVWKLQDFCFASNGQLPLGVNDGPCPDPHHRCRSGKYTLLLEVTDTDGNAYHDTQQLWFDNKPISVEFSGLENVDPCDDVKLSDHALGGSCATPWPMNALGIAYDEYIDETDTSYPSDNFDLYTLTITRQGGPSFTVPITPDLVTFGPDPFRGTNRVGDPGTRCEPLPAMSGCPAPPPTPPKTSGTLTMLDLRIFDAGCASSLSPPFVPPPGPPGFALNRGECCGYTFQVYAQDKTWSDGHAGGLHHAWSLPWAVCICNDLPET